MKKICAVIALLLLLLLPVASVHALETGKPTILGRDGKVLEDSEKASIPDSSDDDSDEEVKEEEEETEEEEEKTTPEDEEGLFKGLRATFKGALDDFTFSIINQFMEGSVNIFEAETEVNENGDSETVSYTINAEPIDPYDPPFVRDVQLPTGGFYLIGIFFTILGSSLMRLIYEKYPVQFNEFRLSLTGEEKPYNNDTITTASVIAFVLWIVYILLVKGIVGFRNLVVSTASSTGIILPDTYANSLPTFALTGIASYSSAFQSATGEYGIYTFNALMFVAGIVSEVFLILGTSGAFWKFNIIYWGVFTVFCFTDIIIVSAISIGVSLYIQYGNPIYVTVGLVFSVIGLVILLFIIVNYAVKRVKKTQGVE